MASFLFVKMLDHRAVMPARNFSTDAGIDLWTIEDTHFQPFEIKKIRTGLALQLVNKYESDYVDEDETDLVDIKYGEPSIGGFIKLMERSGISAHTPLMLKAGVIDNYTGEIIAIMQNVSPNEFLLSAQVKMCQAVPLHKYYTDKIIQVDELIETERGDKGFGSSDKKETD